MQSTRIPNKRNYGIDLLRLIAAFYVVLLHTVLQGGIYASTVPGTLQHASCQMLMSVSYCAVNIFGIISGYVGYSDSEKKLSLSAYSMTWLQVTFYGTVITLLGFLLFPGRISPIVLRHTLLPVTSNLHWYFTAYTLLFFFMPILNNAVRCSSSQTLLLFFCVILFLFSPFESLLGLFQSNSGYSFLWLMILYLLGSVIRKLHIEIHVCIPNLLIGIISITVLSFTLYNLLPKLNNYLSILSPAILGKYTFPLYLYLSVLYVLLFAKLELHAFVQKIAVFSAPAAFSVYIVNSTPIVWSWLKDRFCNWASCSATELLLYVVAFSSIFVFLVVLADYFRRMLFRLLRIENAFLRLFRKKHM